MQADDSVCIFCMQMKEKVTGGENNGQIEDFSSR